MMTDFRHEPGRKIAVRLREWAALLERAVATLERRTVAYAARACSCRASPFLSRSFA
jgi:hypothetical protein